jgi:hypothetical protein
VIIDAEPWGLDLSKPAEIGISLVPAFHDIHINIYSLATLEALHHALRLETHWIRVAGRDRREGNREIARFGQRHDTKDNQVETTISNLIDSFKQKHYGQCFRPASSPEKGPLILAAFSINFEFRILSKLYPQVLQHFTSWLDLQEIASEVATDSGSRLILPGLHETLTPCGFRDSAEARGSKTLQHNAANDTVRAAAILTHFMAMDVETESSLSIPVSSKKHNHARRYRQTPATPEQTQFWNGRRPTPKELYPYGARVSRTTGCIDLDTRALFDLFAPYNPVAVGISKGKRYGWVCLHDLEALEHLVRSIEGSSLSGGYTWKATSDYDSTVVPMQSRDEYKASQRRAMEADADEKRAQRQAKKEAVVTGR